MGLLSEKSNASETAEYGATDIGSSSDSRRVLAIIVIMLRDLLSAVGDIRRSLAGTSKRWLTVAEFAEMCGRSPYTVRRWVSEGRVQATRVNGTGPKGRLLISRDQIPALIADGLGEAIPARLASDPAADTVQESHRV